METSIVYYADGTPAVVVPPPVFRQTEAGAIWHGRIVRSLHLELLKKAEGFTAWPPESADPSLVKTFPRIYEALGNLIGVRALDLTPESRHRLFIATDPEQFGDRLLPGLSNLEQLMGYRREAKKTAPPDPKAKDFPTSGSQELDVLTDFLLTFRESSDAMAIASCLSLDEMAKVTLQANKRMSAAMEQNTEAPSQPQWDDTKEFEQQKEDVLRQVKTLGIQMPSGI